MEKQPSETQSREGGSTETAGKFEDKQVPVTADDKSGSPSSAAGVREGGSKPTQTLHTATANSQVPSD